MVNILVTLFDMKISPVFLALEVNLLQIQEMLVVSNVQVSDLFLKRFLLVVVEKLLSVAL